MAFHAGPVVGQAVLGHDPKRGQVPAPQRGLKPRARIGVGGVAEILSRDQPLGPDVHRHPAQAENAVAVVAEIDIGKGLHQFESVDLAGAHGGQGILSERPRIVQFGPEANATGVVAHGQGRAGEQDVVMFGETRTELARQGFRANPQAARYGPARGCGGGLRSDHRRRLRRGRMGYRQDREERCDHRATGPIRRILPMAGAVRTPRRTIPSSTTWVTLTSCTWVSWPWAKAA